MLNIHQNVLGDPKIDKFEIGDLLFAKYSCPIEAEKVDIWAHMDYVVHVVSGKKIWHTMDQAWKAEAGQTIFFKKGAAIVEQFFDKDFCFLLFFVPDDFVREVLNEFPEKLSGRLQPQSASRAAIRVEEDATLSVYFQSMLSYFAGSDTPPEILLRLKLKELITSILVSKTNPELACYFQTLSDSGSYSLSEVLEKNFRFNLSLEEFAELSNRSLSTFKRDFRKQYGEPPGKWLLNRRLEFASTLIRNSESSISEIAFESGFEDLSHFSRAFKEKYGIPPSEFKTAKIGST